MGDVTNRILILGNGELAAEALRRAAAMGLEAEAVVPPRTGAGENTRAIREIALEELAVCRGSAGGFQLRFSRTDGNLDLHAAAVLLAFDPLRDAIPPGSWVPASPKILSSVKVTADMVLSGLETGAVKEEPRQVAFLLGLDGESHPFLLRETLEACQELETNHRVRTHVMVGNLKVGDRGLESLVRQCRKAGTLFTKFDRVRPEIEAVEEDAVIIRYTDPVLGEACTPCGPTSW
jgi:hypothetical protein